MEDPRTRQSIDDLADLYLTGVSQRASIEAIQGPAPIRLAPKPVAAAAAEGNTARQSPPADDSHPILRLTEDDATPNRLAGPPQAVAQAVLLGNLPGLSGPWLTQYAQLLAQEKGPVAVLHVDDEVIELELVEPRVDAEPAMRAEGPATRVPPPNGDSGLIGLLDALVRNNNAPVRTVLVRLSAQPEAMSVSRLSALDRWTVLCGADDAAVVGCYRTLKQVVEHDPRNAGKQVQLFIMGSDDAAAQGAADKIAATASSALSTPVTLAGYLRQMQPVSVRALGSFADPVALWPGLVAWLETLQAPATAPADQPSSFAEPEAVAEPEAPATPEPVIASPLNVPSPRRQPGRVSAPVADETPQPTATNPGDSTASTPRTAKPVTGLATAATHPPVPDLFSLLAQGPAAIEGGQPLDARVPAAPSIQLAIDGRGTVHLLVFHSQADDPRRAVPEMMEARRWVAEQHAVLALTQRDRDFADPKQAPPVLHLFTDRAELATALVARLGDALKLHLLQKVTLGRETGWFCTPLN